MSRLYSVNYIEEREAVEIRNGHFCHGNNYFRIVESRFRIEIIEFILISIFPLHTKILNVSSDTNDESFQIRFHGRLSRLEREEKLI